MSRHRGPYQIYRVLLRLYPKAHRQEYGGQMLQTLDDMLSERQTASEKVAVWLRIGRELPLNIIEEHISNLEGKNMAELLKSSNKRTGIIVSIGAILVLGIGLGFFIDHGSIPYSPTTFARLQHTDSKPACLQKAGTNSVTVDAKNTEYIGNNVAGSITDALAGTNVDVFFKTYTGSTATGTAVYGGKYGNYNFRAEISTGDTGDTHYFGKWKITRFQPCKS